MKNGNAVMPELSVHEGGSLSRGSLLNDGKSSLWLLLAVFFASLALASPSGAASSKENALHTIGMETVQAIASGDAAYIASIVDAKGIYVGYDGVRHPTESFKNDLAHHVGLYCELFGRGCKTDHNPDYTLEHVLSSGAKPTTSDLKFKINGSVGTVECWEFGGEGDLIVTLSYRFAGGQWYLYNIYYV